MQQYRHLQHGDDRSNCGTSMQKRPIGIDLFAGVGGMSLGFEQAGFDIAAAVEIDPIHAAAHHYNFPQTTVIPRSIVGLSGKEVRALANIDRRAGIDVVFGGPPCQGFSLIGHRLLDDPRNQLVKEFVRLVGELDASSFVFENVKGLTVGGHRVFLETVIDAFKDLGYRVQIPWKVLNAINYGVPQTRQRLFLLGVKNKFAVPAYPPETTSIHHDTNGLAPTPTCFDALADLPDAELFPELLSSDSVPYRSKAEMSGYARELNCRHPSSWHFGHVRNWRPDLLTSSMRSKHTEISRRRFADTPEGEVEPVSRFLKLSRTGYCNTLRAGTDAARGAFTSPRPIHFSFPRCITVREMARLHGYPDWFRFHATKWHGARQVGNSVPPPLARAVAASVLKALEIMPYKPDAKIDLGDPKLLTMDMGKAAAFWNIAVPIGKRDRKNGSQKRTQLEIEAILAHEKRKIS